MSIAQKVNFEQLESLVQEQCSRESWVYHGQYWIYKTLDGEFIGCTVRTEILPDYNKQVIPWILKNGKWKSQKFWDILRPIYGIEQLSLHPDKPILFVEGEKTAEAGRRYFPEFNSVTWPGGCKSVANADLSLFHDMKIYLLPDNDQGGYEAMDILAKKLNEQNNKLFMVDIKKLRVTDKWDIADLDKDSGEIEPAQVRGFVLATKQYSVPILPFDLLSYPELSKGKYPKPLDTTRNVKHLLDHFKIKVSWNMMKRTRDVIVPGVKFYEEESENASLTYLTNLAVNHGCQTKRIDKHLDSIGWDNLYHPVRDWILKHTLIKKGIFREFLETVQTTNNPLSYILIKRWMISAIAAAFTDSGFCAQGVLVLQGEPGTHKSTFVMSLAPESMRAIKGGLSLDPSKKDDILTSSEYWIAELGELDATFRKADIARLKSHITNDIDDVRRAYAVRNSRMIRRTVYAATVNESRFLVDTTGNRRWWTISVTEPIKTRHGLDMQQVWREVYGMWLSGDSPFLNENEMNQLNELNKDYEYLDPFIEKLDEHFNWDWKDRLWMTSSQILEKIGYDKPSKADVTRMGSILTKRKMQKGIGRDRRSYLMPIFKPNP